MITRGPFVLLVVLLLSPVSSLAATISGRLTDAATGLPLQGSVTITGLADEFVIGPVADANGNYSWTGLPAGTYFVTASRTGYITQTYGSTCIRSWCRASDGVAVVIGSAVQTVSGIDIALQRGGTIAGTVFAAIPAAVSSTTVDVYTTAGEFVTQTFSNSDGHYAAGPLRTGSYYLVFRSSYANFERQAYPNVRCVGPCSLAAAQPVTVVAGSTTSGIDVTLVQSTGSISGTITNGLGGFLFIRARERTTGAEYVAPGSNVTSYTLSNVAPGSYSVWVDMAPPGRLRPIYGAGALACAGSSSSCDAQKMSGTPVNVAPAQAVTGIDFTLPAAGVVSGEVRRASDNQLVTGLVTLVSSANVTVASVTAFSGAFTIDQLPAGRYYAWASAQVAGLASQTYSGTACPSSGCVPLTGTPIDVVSGATTSGVNFALGPAATATVSGHVRDILGSPLAGTLVQLWSNSESLPYFGTAAADGSFSFSAPAGTYYIRTDATYGGGAHADFADTWYGGVCVGCDTTKGSAISVIAGQTAGPIDFALSPGPSASGMIQKPTTFSSTIVVEAYSASGVLVRSMSCQFVSSCLWTIRGLTPGFYSFIARDAGQFTQQVILIDQLYPNTDCAIDCTQLNPTRFYVAFEDPVDFVNFNLRVGARIRGRATASDLSLPTAPSFGTRAFTVEAVDALGRRVGRTYSYFEQFQISGLPSGTYYLHTTNGQASGYRDEIYDNIPCNGCAIEGGTPIHVVAGQIASGYEILLDPAAGLQGTVVDAGTSAPLENVEVRVYSATGTPVGSVTTGPGGSWQVGGLAPGDYFVATENSRFYVDVVYGGGTCAPCEVTRGQAITIASGSTPAAIQIALERGGGLAGTVADQSGIGLPDVIVRVTSGSGAIAARTKTDRNGRYQAVVAAGAVTVQTEPFGGRAPQVYPSAVNVVGGSLLDGINFTLATCGSLQALPMGPQLRYLSSAGGVQVTAFGGTKPYTFSVISGSIPRGWTFDAALGSANGVPTTPGRYTYVVGITDAAGCATSTIVDVSIERCAPVLDSDIIGIPREAGTRTIVVAGTCPVEVHANDPWMTVSTSLLSAPGTFVLTWTPNAAAGNRQGTVGVGPRLIRVIQAGTTSTNPFGSVDTPVDGASVHGSIAVGGWALDDIGIERVRVMRDSVDGEPQGLIFIGDAVRVRGARPDVDQLFPTLPEHERAGWGYLLLTNMLPHQGNGTFRLHAFARDAEGHEVLLGSRTIVANNTGALPPFGAIDTPGQGETIAGSAYVNFGWALTALPNTIPIDGSTISVIIDGVNVGPVTYNNFREDIAALFPGLNNSNGAVGFKSLDTTQLADGVHTIAWVVTDDSGAAEGIGSRYFTVANGAALQLGARASVSSTAMRATPVRHITARELERIEFDVPRAEDSCGPIDAYERVGGERRPLPVGSSFDAATGHFVWQPGPGFIGSYRLVFAKPACAAGAETMVSITIR